MISSNFLENTSIRWIFCCYLLIAVIPSYVVIKYVKIEFDKDLEARLIEIACSRNDSKEFYDRLSNEDLDNQVLFNLLSSKYPHEDLHNSTIYLQNPFPCFYLNETTSDIPSKYRYNTIMIYSFVTAAILMVFLTFIWFHIICYYEFVDFGTSQMKILVGVSLLIFNFTIVAFIVGFISWNNVKRVVEINQE